MTLNHLVFIRSRRDRRASQLRIRKLLNRAGTVKRLTVIHEPDGRCCQAESWSTTFARLIEALNLDGQHALGVVLAPVTSTHQPTEGDAA